MPPRVTRREWAELEAEFALRRAVREYVAEHDGCTIAEARHALDIGRTDFLELARDGIRGVRFHRRRGDALSPTTLHLEEGFAR
jgi:hypothetical protein